MGFVWQTIGHVEVSVPLEGCNVISMQTENGVIIMVSVVSVCFCVLIRKFRMTMRKKGAANY